MAAKSRMHAMVIGFIFLAMLLSIVLPLRQYEASKAQIRSLQRTERSLDAQAAQLETERRRLSSDAEVERLAREHLNMVRPGEVAFAITGTAPDSPPAGGVAKRTVPRHRPWYKALWHWVWGG